MKVKYVGGHDAVDVHDPETGRDVHRDVKQGAEIEVDDALAKSLLEQEDNWQRVDKPKAEKESK